MIITDNLHLLPFLFLLFLCCISVALILLKSLWNFLEFIISFISQTFMFCQSNMKMLFVSFMIVNQLNIPKATMYFYNIRFSILIESYSWSSEQCAFLLNETCSNVWNFSNSKEFMILIAKVSICSLVLFYFMQLLVE